jgi:uncharacterized protein DUF5818
MEIDVMRKLCLLTAALLLSSAWVVAQSNSQSGTYNSSQSSSSSEKTIEGCLSGSAGSFTLSDNSGKTYQLQGDTAKLKDEVGHQVRVKGTEAGTSASSSSPSSSSQSSSSSSGVSPSSSSASNPSSSSAGSSAATQFNVTKISKVSDTCTASSSSK